MKAILHKVLRQAAAWARSLRAAVAEPGPLETDVLRREGAVFQRVDVRRPR